MFSTSLLALSAALPLALAQTLTNETVLGVYMFHRHGDRTAKSTPPANLTDLGHLEVFTSGTYYRDRYVASNSPYRISGINSDLVLQSQIQFSAPDDTVLQNSAMGFAQALYPPVGSSLDTETLRNGTVVTAPLQGYQLIPIELVETGTGSEDASWLQSTTNCGKATISSNNFFDSAEYTALLNSTQDFYQNLTPVTVGTFNASQMDYKNAYTIYDLINVAQIHNSTYPSSNLITDPTFFQLRTLADSHEWGLAYNSSDTIRAISGATVAAQAVQFLNATITSAGKTSGGKFAAQFGAYSTFMSFFGLADLPSVHSDFYGVCDYASAMTFEMFTNSSTAVTSSSYPSEDEIFVRFLWHNGTTNNASQPVAYPLFGSGQEALSWADFTAGMNKFAIGNTEQWCTACGNFTGSCAAYAPGGSSSSGSSSGAEGGVEERCPNGISPAVNGVIGAMVTLAVVLGVEALILLLGGLRVVSKKRLAGVNGGAVSPGSGEPKP